MPDDEEDGIKYKPKCYACKKAVVDCIKCLRCNQVYHRSCGIQRKIQLISQDSGLCCYSNDSSENLTFIAVIVKSNEDLLTQINLMKQLNNEIMYKNKLLMEKIEEYKNNQVADRTYASVVGDSSKEKIKPNDKNVPSVLIGPKNTQDFARTREDIKKFLSPSELNIGINNIKSTKTGKAIIRCNTKEELSILKKAAEIKLKDKYDVSQTTLNKPRMRIVGYSGDSENVEEIVQRIRKQNKFIEDRVEDKDEFTVVYKTRIKDGKSNLILECSPSIYHKFMQHRRLYLGWERLPVFEDINVHRCFRCQEYTHKGKDCRNLVRCGRCAQEHRTEDCKSSIRRCVNCSEANTRYNLNYGVEHASDSRECPSFQFRTRAAKSRTDYG